MSTCQGAAAPHVFCLHGIHCDWIEPCPVVIGQQKGIGPGLFITCGKPHTVAEHRDDEVDGG